jgi:proline dehydrogenase
MKRTIRAALRGLAQRASRTYVVGPELADALRACRSLDAVGFSSTVTFWNAETDAPRDIAGHYMAAINAIGAEEFDCYVSVKAPPLRYSGDLFDEILQCARRHKVGVHFDSLSPQAADPTFSLISELRPAHADIDIGCTLPGRWGRSPADADRAADLGLRVRVVKGQWADTAEPPMDPRRGFLSVIDRLAGRARHVAVATHDPDLAREALRRLRAAGTPCELELLFGLPLRRPIAAAEAHGAPIRIYVPYGYAWLPYVVDQMKKNPRIAWWVLCDLCTAARLTVAPAAPHPRLPSRSA